MTTKHTPGPWSVRYDYVVQASSFDGGRLVPVAQPYGVNADGTDLFANARLIAAAPDLLNLLNEAVELQRKHYGDGMLLHMEMAWWAEKASAAIAKAKGEQQ